MYYVNESVFSFLHQLTTWHCSYLLLSARPADVDRYPMAAEPTAANPPLWHAAREEGTGGCTDGRTLDSSIDPAQHAVRASQCQEGNEKLTSFYSICCYYCVDACMRE